MEVESGLSLIADEGGKDERRKGGKEERRKGGKEERRKGGKEERRRGGKEERRRGRRYDDDDDDDQDIHYGLVCERVLSIVEILKRWKFGSELIVGPESDLTDNYDHGG